MINSTFWLKWHKSLVMAAPPIAEWYYNGHYYIRVTHGHLVSITGGRDISLQEMPQLTLKPYGLVSIDALGVE